MLNKYRIGIDGGGTHCRGRLVDENDTILAECTGGPANVFADYDQALAEVDKIIDKLYNIARLAPNTRESTTMVAGLAGANVPSIKKKLANWQPKFNKHYLFSDVETACIGAHQAQPGSVFIMGTGSQGATWNGECFTSLGGWGFMISDMGSGAVLGQKALRLALLAHEKIIPHSPFTHSIMQRYQHNPEKLLEWSTVARTKDWADCVKSLFYFAEQQDPHAKDLVTQSAKDTELMIAALLKLTPGPLCLMGGLSEPIIPWLSDTVQAQLTPPCGDALVGALLIATNNENLGNLNHL